ncbi:hypothetical protein IE81DRAFT_363861 [Ceraceosorus guamensis]|uniref:AB hydrolase-1 domain-containing protein n=1 Tax=Ceraceosorus guamensis TaxID=1522189 RepID=A0A316WCM9_9BASI|nr:hypothetical protein IE81DRAFT_363861 [Ceraceosorus guamensis]PWN45623.1 hypothetical protein IE81DRAFT_363861 [Ceraceosorus guamensis]
MAVPLLAAFTPPLRATFASAPALVWPSRAGGPPKIVLLFIPGNPGLAEYYTPYLSALSSAPALQGQIEIICVSHLGHAAPSPTPTTLRAQVAHKLLVIDAARAAYPTQRIHGREERPRFVLGGHSVGAYIALECLKERRHVVDSVHMLFPTVSWIGKTPNARKLAPLFHPIVPAFFLPLPLLVLSLLPFALLLPLIRLLTRQNFEAAKTTTNFLVTPGAVRSAVNMAAEEMREIRKLRDETIKAVREVGSGEGKVRAYWARGEEDGWAPSWIRKQVESALTLSPLTAPPSDMSAPSLKKFRTFSISALRSRRQAHQAAKASKPPPITPPRLNNRAPRRRPSLIGARAVRSIDGSISIEAPDDSSATEYAGASTDDETVTLSHNTPKAAARALDSGSAVIESPEVELDLNTALAGSAKNVASHPLPAFTSAVCNVGMPHAFCLDHSEHMARITAAWLAQDHL